MTLGLIVPKLQLFKHISTQPICDLFAMSYLRGPADSSLDFAAIASEVLLLAGVGGRRGGGGQRKEGGNHPEFREQNAFAVSRRFQVRHFLFKKIVFGTLKTFLKGFRFY